MPHKFNADRRDKIPKQKQSVTNWAEYNRVLRQRGNVTFWISEVDALTAMFVQGGLHTCSKRDLDW